MYDVLQRDVPEQLVLTEQRNVRLDELVDWLRAAMGRVHNAAESYGGLVAPLFVIYHGPPGDGVDMPVEVCAPIEPSSSNGEAAAMRREPAHREAYVRVRKAQAVAPHIQSAYAAVEKWIGEQGLQIADAPREVYFTDFMSAAPTDEVCDVAFPIHS